MSRNARAWGVAVSLTALLLAGASPARAAEDPGTEPPAWSMAPCVQIEAMRTGFALHRQYNMIEGSVAQCDPVVVRGGFRIATYGPDDSTGFAPGYNVRLFASEDAGAVRDFAVAVPYIEGQFGLCVLAAQDERIGCYRVEVTDGEETFVNLLSPLATDDPLVDKEVRTSPYTGALGPTRGTLDVGPLPACGTCF